MTEKKTQKRLQNSSSRTSINRYVDCLQNPCWIKVFHDSCTCTNKNTSAVSSILDGFWKYENHFKYFLIISEIALFLVFFIVWWLLRRCMKTIRYASYRVWFLFSLFKSQSLHVYCVSVPNLNFCHFPCT